MSTLITDDFNRADGGLGANWTTVTGYQDPQIDTNQVRALNTGTLLYAVYTATALPDDQWDQVSIAAIEASRCDHTIVLRANTTDFAYEFTATGTGGTFTTRIVQRVAGVGTVIGTENATTWAVNDVLYGQVIGNQVTLKRNGSVLLGPVTDTTLASGLAGISLFDNFLTTLNCKIDDFTAGGFATAFNLVRP